MVNAALLVYTAWVGLSNAANLISFASWIVGVGGLLVALWAAWKSPDADNARSDLAADIDEFAFAVNDNIRREYARCRIEDPAPIPVRWSRCDPAILDDPVNIFGAREFPKLKSSKDIHERYTQIPSGRMVILGAPGAGKTIVAMRLAASLIARRTPGDAVPVMLNIASWNAHQLDLRRWLASELPARYEQLGSVRGGRTLADALLERQLIVPILDGFDELSTGTYTAAMRELNVAADLPLIITSRADEYSTTVTAEGVLSRADGIAIQGLSLDDFENYLPHTTNRRTQIGRNLWCEVLAQIRTDPAARPVRRAMKTPLVAFLLRSIYSNGNRDPHELIDPTRFLTGPDVETFLAGAFVDAVYGGARSPRDPSDVRLWLGRLAVAMQRDSRSAMGWWDIRDSAAVVERVLVFAVLGGLGGAAILGYLSPWFGAGLGAGMGIGVNVNAFGPRPSIVRIRSLNAANAFLSSALALVGAELALIAALLFLPEHGILAHRSLHNAIPNPWWAAGTGFIAGFFLGLVDSGVKRKAGKPQNTQVAAFGWGLLTAILGIIFLGYIPGFVFGAFASMVTSIIASSEAAPDLHEVPSTRASVKRDRAITITKFLGFGSLIGLPAAVFSLPGGVASAIWLGLAAGAANGFGVALGMNAWGHWLVITRLWLPLTHRLPFDVIDFLDEAHEKGVLRQIGGMYEFRHSSLQQALIDGYLARQADR